MDQDSNLTDLDGWRRRIDEINAELVALLNARASCAVEIGKLKRKNNLPIFDPQRENHILEKVSAVSKGPLSDEALVRIFKTIMEENRALE